MVPDNQSAEAHDAARRIGQHLRAGRRRHFPHDTQSDFARRIGVSRATYQKMERGDPQVAFASYLTAASLLGRLEDVVDAFTPGPRSLFE